MGNGQWSTSTNRKQCPIATASQRLTVQKPRTSGSRSAKQNFSCYCGKGICPCMAIKQSFGNASRSLAKTLMSGSGTSVPVLSCWDRNVQLKGSSDAQHATPCPPKAARYVHLKKALRSSKAGSRDFRAEGSLQPGIRAVLDHRPSS